VDPKKRIKKDEKLKAENVSETVMVVAAAVNALQKPASSARICNHLNGHQVIGERRVRRYVARW